MAKDKRPWWKFFPRDWLIDAELRGCSLATQGLWIQMLCLMYECDRRGVLETVGVAWDDERIVSAIAGNSDVVRSCLHEVLSAGVASRCGSGNPCPCGRVPCPSTDAVICRRMVRDEIRSQIASEHGKMGGNPTLKGVVKAPLNHTLTSDICPLNSEEKEKEVRKERARTLFGLYPRREGRKAALVAIGVALEKVDYETLRLAVVRYANDPDVVQHLSRDEKCFVKLPTTYFRGEHWTDEVSDTPADKRKRYREELDRAFSHVTAEPRENVVAAIARLQATNNKWDGWTYMDLSTRSDDVKRFCRAICNQLDSEGGR